MYAAPYYLCNMGKGSQFYLCRGRKHVGGCGGWVEYDGIIATFGRFVNG